MRVINLQAENFKVLHAVEITPEGHVVEITGKNGSGKSSVLDAIYVALVGRSVAPPKPVRNGEETCQIRLDLGDLTITRKFTIKDGGQMTDSLKVENADGLRYSKPQEVLDALLGEIGFDPFGFCQMKPKEQAEALLQMVPLPVDLDEMAELDQSDFQKRRDINRDVASLKSQMDAIPKEDVPAEVPDRASLVEQLGNAANTNTAIEHDRVARERTASNIEVIRNQAEMARQSAERLRREAAEQEALAVTRDEEANGLAAGLEALPPLAEPVDTDAIRDQLRTADETLAKVERQKRRTDLESRHTTAVQQSEALTAAMADRARKRNEALAGAKMPIQGLAFALDEKGQPVVQFGGVPFEQASTAEQLRASTAIAMSANPSLRVLRIKDGSLLDDDSMSLLAEMAKADDFQLWIERVGTGGVGIVMENGEVKAAPTGKAKAQPEKPEGALV